MERFWDVFESQFLSFEEILEPRFLGLEEILCYILEPKMSQMVVYVKDPKTGDLKPLELKNDNGGIGKAETDTPSNRTLGGEGFCFIGGKDAEEHAKKLLADFGL